MERGSNVGEVLFTINYVNRLVIINISNLHIDPPIGCLLINNTEGGKYFKLYYYQIYGPTQYIRCCKNIKVAIRRMILNVKKVYLYLRGCS
jgi:hypothetical protein